MASKLKIKVNGLVHSVTASLDTPLLYVLRNELKLNGPQFGCGLAQCGACAVLLDGKEIRSRVTPVAAVTDKPIHTLEGLPAHWANVKGIKLEQGMLHPVQQAWIDEQVPQCGYCQSGMMIVAVQLLAKNPNPTVAQIKDAFTHTPLSSRPCNAPPPRCARESRRLDDCKNKSVQRIASRVSHDPHATHSPHHAPRLRKNGRRSFRVALDSCRTFPPCRRKPHVA